MKLSILRLLFPRVGWLFLFVCSYALAADPVDEKPDPFVESLLSQMAKEKDKEHLILMNAQVAEHYRDLNQYEHSNKYLTNILTQLAGTKVDDYLLFRMAENQFNLGLLNEAKQSLHKLASLPRSTRLIYNAQFLLGNIAIRENDWKKARQYFGALERWRQDPLYGEVLYNLMRAEMHTGRKWKMCRWARKIYARFPELPQLSSWSVDLQSNQVDGKATGCFASPVEQSGRMRRLIIIGENTKAEAELKILMQRASSFTRFHVDKLQATFWAHQGEVEKALKLLVKHYPEMKDSYAFLIQLGTLAARSGEFQTAVGAYYRAYQLNPRARAARRALFQAAFMSYQFQDYDGAARKFEEFTGRYGTTGLGKDAQWQLAWIRYLKGDFTGAYISLSGLTGHGRKFRNKFPAEKLQFWMAMCLMRSGKTDEAKNMFRRLIRDDETGYYSMLSRGRLLQLGERIEALADRQVASVKQNEELTKSKEGGEESDEQLTLPDTDAAEAEETGSTNLATEEETEGTPETGESYDMPAEGDEIAQSNSPTLKDARLKSRFDRARYLAHLNLKDMAKWEMQEIEKMTRKPEDFKTLAVEYLTVDAYDRSAFLGQNIFSGIFGVDRATTTALAYPKAYEDTVNSNSQNFSVPRELIWSIMRAESSYRADALSPVGAMGLMQLMPYTATKVSNLLLGEKEFDPHKLREPDMNIRLGARYLKKLMDRFSGKIPLVAAAYNAGPHRVHGWLSSFGRLDMDEFVEHIPFLETRNYVKRVVQNYQMYSNLYPSKEKPSIGWLNLPVGVRLEGATPTRETWDE